MLFFKKYHCLFAIFGIFLAFYADAQMILQLPLFLLMSFWNLADMDSVLSGGPFGNARFFSASA